MANLKPKPDNGQTETSNAAQARLPDAPSRLKRWARENAAPIRSARWLSYMALLIAMQVILGRFFAIRITDQLRISIGFLPVAVAAYLMGAVPAVLVACVSDVLGSLLFSPPYMPGFTVTAALNALLFALSLRTLYAALPERTRTARWRAFSLATLVCAVIGCGAMAFLSNTLLNTFWMKVYYGKAFGALVPVRFLKNLAEWPIDAAILCVILTLLRRMPAALLPRPLPDARGHAASDKGGDA